jgi:hypothetical protein
MIMALEVLETSTGQLTSRTVPPYLSAYYAATHSLLGVAVALEYAPLGLLPWGGPLPIML